MYFPPPGRLSGDAFPRRSSLAPQSRRRRAPLAVLCIFRLRGAFQATPSLVARPSLLSPGDAAPLWRCYALAGDRDQGGQVAVLLAAGVRVVGVAEVQPV